MSSLMDPPQAAKAVAAAKRTRSWSSPSLADAATASGEEYDSDDSAPVLFDTCRFPEHADDLLDCALGEEPWQAASEASSRRHLRIVGEVSALKRLFTLPLRSAGEAVCLHRIGDCLIALEVPENARPLDGYAEVMGAADATVSPRTSTIRSHVRVEGELVRIYPHTHSAEPVDVSPPLGVASKVAACCEWRVREGVSLLAVTPQPSTQQSQGVDAGFAEACDFVDLRSMQARKINAESWLADRGHLGEFADLGLQSSYWPSPPAYHRRVAGYRCVVKLVRLPESLDSDVLVDAWLSCCLVGSPSLLCFFLDTKGILRGCRFVVAADIPKLGSIAKAYHPSSRCLSGTAFSSRSSDHSNGNEVGMEGFDPRSFRDMSHLLLDRLIDRLDHDGGQCLVVAHPLGIHFLNASLQVTGPEDALDSSDDENASPAVPIASASPMLEDLALNLELLPGFDRRSTPTPPKTPPSARAGHTTPGDAVDGAAGAGSLVAEAKDLLRLKKTRIAQALLLYHAAVRLASPCWGQAGRTQTGMKDVPVGSRWTTKSCCHPIRVRQMMLRVVHVLRSVIAMGQEDDKTRTDDVGKANVDKDTLVGDKPSPVRDVQNASFRFMLLFASAFEFVADTFLAEDACGDDMLDSTRQLSALRYMRKSNAALAGYVQHAMARTDEEGFARSVRRLEERVLAKQINAHLCLARIRQRQPWGDGSAPSYRKIGASIQELDAAEQLVLRPPYLTQAARPLGSHENSLLASIAKWKADLLFELVAIAAPAVAQTTGAVDTVAELSEYLKGQQDDLKESPQPLPLQQERWLQSIVSLSLRSLHHLASVPVEMVGELQAQARSLLARAYGYLGRIYANTGRYTKAMTHAKQGIELFSATKDTRHAAALQIWLCRLQLRMAVPQASNSSGGGLADSSLMQGFSAVSGAEDATCTQVAATLQRASAALESDDTEDQVLQVELQTLLSRVILRQALSRIARSSKFRVVCGLCEENSAVPSVLELLQCGESASLDSVKDAVELLLRASAHCRDAGESRLNSVIHACLAATYFRARTDVRTQRLALTHCQHALEYMSFPATPGSHPEALRLAIRLIEVRVMRNGVVGSGRNSSSQATRGTTGDNAAVAALCDVALSCLQLAGNTEDSRSRSCSEDAKADDADNECPAVIATMLAAEEQRLPLLSYVRQELGELLLRLLKSAERIEGSGRELKSLYGALLTAWHTDAGQVPALTALRDYTRDACACGA